MNTSGLISIIIIKKEKEIGLANPLFPVKKSRYVYIAFIDEWEKGAKNLIRADGNQKEKREYCEISAIPTPWVLFLEEQEYLLSADYKRLIDHVEKKESAVTALNIERLVPQSILENYKWVTTRNIFKNPSKTMRQYFTSEIRLIPADYLKDIILTPISKVYTHNQFILKLPQDGMDITKLNIVISRQSKNSF